MNPLAHPGELPAEHGRSVPVRGLSGDLRVARMAACLAVELVPPPEGSPGRDPLQALVELLVNAWLRAKNGGNVL